MQISCAVVTAVVYPYPIQPNSTHINNYSIRLTKLAGLLIKTLSKPLSKQIKHQVSRSATGQRVLISIGQFTNNITSRMTIWAAGYRVRRITPLESEEALKTGAEFVGESVIFLVSGTWLLYEYNQGVKKAAAAQEAKRAQAKAERDELRTQLRAIDARLVALETALEKQWNLITPSYRPPPEKEKVPIAPGSSDDRVASSTELQSSQSKRAEPRSWRKWIWPF